MARMYTVEIVEGVAVLGTSPSSDMIGAKVLGDETGSDDARKVWLDRRVHLEGDTALTGVLWRGDHKHSESA